MLPPTLSYKGSYAALVVNEHGLQAVLVQTAVYERGQLRRFAALGPYAPDAGAVHIARSVGPAALVQAVGVQGQLYVLAEAGRFKVETVQDAAVHRFLPETRAPVGHGYRFAVPAVQQLAVFDLAVRAQQDDGVLAVDQQQAAVRADRYAAYQRTVVRAAMTAKQLRHLVGRRSQVNSSKLRASIVQTARAALPDVFRIAVFFLVRTLKALGQVEPHAAHGLDYQQFILWYGADAGDADVALRISLEGSRGS